jgi:hypothetical protein
MESATLTRPQPGSIWPGRLRALGPAGWAKLGFAAMCAGALVGYFVYPTYPTYDSFYALLWGRDVLHLHLPDFRVYRGPTEHPLAIAFGAFCSIFGQGGARLMVLGSIGSFVALVAGMYRLGRLCFGPVVGLVAGLLVLSRFFIENLAAQGYLDISYVALIVWAVVLEVQRPRRGPAVLLVLAAAGLLRPDAWLLSGVYWLWCSWPALRGALAGGARRESVRRPLGWAALALIAPVVWVLVDLLVTGKPFYSLNSTAGLAQELGRTQGLASVIGSVWTFAVRIDKVPVLIGAIAGAGPRAHAAGGARPAARGVRARGRRRRVGDRPLPARRGGDAAAVLRRRGRRLGDARAGHDDAPGVDGRRGGARRLRRVLGGDDAQPVEPAHDARLPRGFPPRPRGGPALSEGRGGTEALSAAFAARQQADPQRALDPRSPEPARHRRPHRGPGGRRTWRRQARTAP